MNILIASLADQRIFNVAVNVIHSGGKVPVHLSEVECKLEWKSRYERPALTVSVSVGSEVYA
jgi:hypothetical protein